MVRGTTGVSNFLYGGRVGGYKRQELKLGGGGDTVTFMFCPVYTLIISLASGFTSPFPHFVLDR